MVALHETVAVPDPARLVLLIFPQLRPFGTVSVKATVPVNPFREVMVMVVRVDWPVLTAPGEVVEIVKFGAGGSDGRPIVKV